MSNDQVEKYIEIENKLKDVSTRKIRIEEQYRSKKENLVEVIDEIKKEGYNPKDLKTVIIDLEKKFSEELKKFEENLNEVSKKLSQIEG